ncbi:MAG TPA: EAL domain-containing protein [Xanthobacteraceae bacterium]|nr:EAL domain-containing protein [Xanthobacteraceae bacterium]
MGRLSALFVAACMVLIAGSIGAVLYLRFGLSGVEVTIVSIAALTGLALLNALTARSHHRIGESGGQVDDLARGTTDLARQISELNRRVAAIEGKAQAAVEKTLAATQPISAELGEVGGIIKQIAETVAAHDTHLKVLAPANAAAIPPSPAVGPKEPSSVPLSPLLAGLPAATGEKPADITAIKPDLADKKPSPAAADVKSAEAKPVDIKPAQATAAEAKAGEAKPVDVKPLEVKATEAKPVDIKAPAFKPAEPRPAEPKASDLKPADLKPAEPKVPESKPLAPKPAAAPTPSFPVGEPAPVAAKPADAKPAEPKPLEPKLPEPKPAMPQPAVASASPPQRIASGRFKDMEPGAVTAMIRAAVDANRIDLFLQPIVTLPQRKVRYYEAVARLRVGDGEPVMAGDFLPFAEAAGLMPQIDNLMLFRCVQVVRRLLAKNREIGLFCNLSSSTLADATTFPQFSEFMEANKSIAPALVFEFTQPALRAMGPIENESLAALAARGYRFSLDNISDLRIEPRGLAERGFRFLKVQAAMLLNRTGATMTDIHPQDVAGLLSRFGIDLIAAKIESEAAVVDLLDYDVKYGQGFLFSPPRPVRPEVMQGVGERNDVVVREAGQAPAGQAAAAQASGQPSSAPAPMQPPGQAPAVAHRASSLAQLARGVVARS